MKIILFIVAGIILLSCDPMLNKAINMSCGVGKWSVQALHEFDDDLESIEMKWVGGAIKMTNSDSIRTFLLNQRTGLDHGTINIRFTNPGKIPQTSVLAPHKE